MENENTLFKNKKLFHDIDIHFADYICRLENEQDNNLWFIAAFVSYFSCTGHSAFSTQSVSSRTCYEVFDIDQDDENASLIIPDLNENANWPNAVGKPGELKPIIFENSLFYLNRYHQYEQIVSNFIKERSTSFVDVKTMKDDINSLFKENTVNDNTPNWQKVAAIMALRSKFAVISGGPGTGKTTTVGKVLALLLKNNMDLRIKLVAPTGKAADRLNESIRNFKAQNNKKLRYRLTLGIPIIM